MLRPTLIAVQACTFVLLGGLLIQQDHLKLGLAQLCLAAVTVLVYT